MAETTDEPKLRQKYQLKVNNEGANWKTYRKSVADFIPDPMVLRAGDLFLMGREQGRHSVPVGDDGAERLWTALDKNISGILTFFDLLVTRNRIPLIDYPASFSVISFDDVLGDLVVHVHVEHEFYRHAKAGALAKLRSYRTSSIGRRGLRDITDELDAFGWEWSPQLEGLQVSEARRPIVQFVLGGLIFGAYAQASGTEHILQSKRSRLFLALSEPNLRENFWAYERERELFKDLREACSTDHHVRYEEVPAPPPIVPYLLAKNPSARTPKDLLKAALDFRESPEGLSYREWRAELREGLAMGRNDPAARRIIDRVLKELNKRYKKVQSDGAEAKVSFEIGAETSDLVGPLGKVKGKVAAKDVPLKLPKVEWLRRWLVENIGMRTGCSKLLLRMGIAQRDYENLTLGLRRIWENG
jgi:hypothetical protein